MKDWIIVFIQTAIILILLISWGTKIEVSIAKIQTDVAWIKKELSHCQQNWEGPSRQIGEATHLTC